MYKVHFRNTYVIVGLTKLVDNLFSFEVVSKGRTSQCCNNKGVAVLHHRDVLVFRNTREFLHLVMSHLKYQNDDRIQKVTTGLLQTSKPKSDIWNLLSKVDFELC